MQPNSKNLQNDETRLENYEQEKIRSHLISEDESANTQVDIGGSKRKVGKGAGIAMGAGGVAAAMTFMSFKEPDVPPVSTLHHDHLSAPIDATSPPDSQPIITEPLHFNSLHIPVAFNVSDGMSFSQAFNAARQEVGPGGVFPWNGNVYATYSDSEWHGLSEQYRHEFLSHNFEIPTVHTADVHADDYSVTLADVNPHHPTGAHNDDFFSSFLSDVHVVSGHDDVSLVHAGHLDVGGNDFSVFSPMDDLHDVSHIDSYVDNSHDVAEYETYYSDGNDFLSDFHNHADISNFV